MEIVLGLLVTALFVVITMDYIYDKIEKKKNSKREKK